MFVEWKQETGMAASSTIWNVGRSRTSESQFAHIKFFRDRASIKMHGDGWNGWFFLSESTDEHARKFYYNLKERRKEKDRKWRKEAFVFIRTSLGKLTCQIHCNIPTRAISAIMTFDPKLIPLFDGTDPGQSVVEWVEKAELVCQLSGVKNIECIVPMCLSGGAYAVYQQLSEEKRADFACIKDVLYTAFALNPMTAYKQLVACRLRLGDTFDVFLVELHKLVTQFRGMMEWGLVCAFIAGLPDHVEKLLQATTQVDDLPISEILARARVILKDSFTGTGKGDHSSKEMLHMSRTQPYGSRLSLVQTRKNFATLLS